MIHLLPKKRWTRLALLVALSAAVAGGAFAYFTATGSGSASGSVGTLSAPVLTATGGSGQAALSWTTVTPPAAGTVTYFVTRDGGTPGGDCPSSASPSGVTSCTDSGLSAGDHDYTVTAKWRTWNSTSYTASVHLASGAATKLVFTTDPFTITTAQTSDTITIERQDTDGNGVPVGTTNVDLSTSSTAGVFRNTDDDKSITSIQIADGSASASFKYRDSHAGAPVLTASASGLASANQTQTVNKGDQTITFGALADRRLDQSPFTVSATASSGLAVSFSSATTSVCSVSGDTVTLLQTGTCTINADQAGDSNWNAAPRVQQSFTVQKGNQTITFGALADKRFDEGPITVSASASSGLAVSFSSATPSVCTVSGSTVNFQSVGTCTVNADQAGNGNWNAAPQVQRSFTISKGNQTISFANPGAKTFDQSPITVSATASSGLAVSFSSATTSVCTSGGTNGATITFVSTGPCTINANQAGNPNWNAAPQVQQSFAVNMGNQTISFTSTAPSNATVGGSTYTATATATSGLTVTFSSATTSVCTSGGTNGATITFVGAGTCTVNADQAGNANWNAAAQAHQSFTVAAATLTITTVVRDGGNKKVHFTGTGAVASTTITVTICAVNSFPCASPVTTSIATNPSAGNWTSAQSGGNLASSQTYFAQAVQGSTTSAVFTFSTTNL